MTGDDTEGQRRRPSDRPDPSFFKRLEDDSLWARDDRSPTERRSDRYKDPGGRRASLSRRTAIVVLVLAAALVVVIGLEADHLGGSAGAGPSVPFTVLPLENNATTSTEAATTTSATPSPTTTATSTTATTVPVAGLGP